MLDAPCAGARIETTESVDPDVVLQNAPCAGARIETPIQILYGSRGMMPPVRGRELKLSIPPESNQKILDAPCAGARIETALSEKRL